MTLLIIGLMVVFLIFVYLLWRHTVTPIPPIPVPPIPPTPPIPPPVPGPTGFYVGPPYVGMSDYEMIDALLDQIETYFRQCAEAGGMVWGDGPDTAPIEPGVVCEVFCERTWLPQFKFTPTNPAHQAALYCPHIYKKVDTVESHGYWWSIWDLTQPDEEIRAKYVAIAALADKYHITMVLRLRDACSYKGKASPLHPENPLRERRTPFVYCAQLHEVGAVDYPWLKNMGLRDVGVIVGGKLCDQVDHWDRLGMDWLKMEHLGKTTTYWWCNEDVKFWVKTFGPRHYYLIFSEAADEIGPGKKKDGETDAQWQARWEANKDRRLYNFHSAYLDFLTLAGVPKNHIIVCDPGRIDQYKKSKKFDGVLFEVHGVNSPERLNEVIKDFGTDRICPNGDGPDKYALGIEGHIGSVTHEPSVEQAKKIRSLLLVNTMPIYCTFSRALEDHEPPEIGRTINSMPCLRSLCGK